VFLAGRTTFLIDLNLNSIQVIEKSCYLQPNNVTVLMHNTGINILRKICLASTGLLSHIQKGLVAANCVYSSLSFPLITAINLPQTAEVVGDIYGCARFPLSSCLVINIVAAEAANFLQMGADNAVQR